MLERSQPKVTPDQLVAEIRAAMLHPAESIPGEEPQGADRLVAVVRAAHRYAVGGGAGAPVARRRDLWRYPARLALGSFLYVSRWLTTAQTRKVRDALHAIAEDVASQKGLGTPDPAARAHELDGLHAELLEAFRGSRDDVRERQRIYLPILRQIDTGSRPALDLACGRGEWLELLRENGWQAYGVDTNRVLVEQCHARGLAVTQDDALAHLRTVPTDSLAVVTAFHLAEHLGFAALVELIDEALRALCPGGVLIVETPDPHNLRVAAYTFYCDPTHRHPLPSPLLKFIVESRGLRDVRVLPLHPTGATDTAGGQAASPFAEYFDGPQDYAVVGWKG